MPPSFTSPGASFTGGFNDFFVQKAQQDHQNLLDSLAQKREGRLAQAELDSMQEKQDELQRKKEKDQQDVHDRLEKEFENSRKDMVKGDRYSPEQLDQAKQLHISLFQQAPPPMSTAVGAPPAALMPNPPPNATPEGGLPTPPGAMEPQVNTYPGSVKERLKEQDEAKQNAFIEALPEGDPRKEELRQAFGAERVGLHVPAGYFSKAAAATKHRVIFDPKAKTYVDGVTHQPITDAADLENAQVDRSAEPNSAGEDRAAARAQAVREHAYTEFKDMSKPLMDRIDRADKLETSLNAHTDIADSTIAEQLVTLTAGGNGSGIRISQPMIEQVLNKSRTKWDDFEQALKRWDASPKDPKSIGLFFTPDQRKAISDLGRLYREQAVKTRKTVLDYRRKVDDAPDDIHEINKIRTAAQEAVLDPAPQTAAAGPKKTAEQILKDAGL